MKLLKFWSGISLNSVIHEMHSDIQYDIAYCFCLHFYATIWLYLEMYEHISWQYTIYGRYKPCDYIKKVIGICCFTFYLNCFSDAEAPPDNIIKFHIDTYHWTMRFRSCRMECQPVLHWVSYNESWYIELSKHSIIYLCFIFYKRVRYNIKVALSWIVNYIV